MLITWSFPRVYVPTPVWRAWTNVTVSSPARPRHEARAVAAAPNARVHEARLDRDTARALVEAGYMPLDRYVALFGDRVAGDRATNRV